jgi:hypothetical protein
MNEKGILDSQALHPNSTLDLTDPPLYDSPFDAPNDQDVTTVDEYLERIAANPSPDVSLSELRALLDGFKVLDSKPFGNGGLKIRHMLEKLQERGKSKIVFGSKHYHDTEYDIAKLIADPNLVIDMLLRFV